ncbi:hypothetical protein [Acinetobacter nosocomialis]|uniref:hypothetical protein n=1 Tax=Acinetobacter nosocomialis TaxID=106654 RepID=UPI001F20C33F|nr:hypothetical protein [Acinetobacter nosocomialis]MCE7534212.1 hypothetical protein [Acinetobacter nosocomialis]
MSLYLVLFIDGEETYDCYDYPLSEHVELTDPVEIYKELKGKYPDRDEEFTHEYKIMWKWK